MKRSSRFKKRTWVLVGLVAAVAAIASVGAFAYFTATGSGSGSATVGTSTAITIASDLNGTDLYPGGVDESIDVHVTNPGSGQQFVDDVTGVFATDDNGTPGDPSDDCLGSWFEVDAIDFNQNIAPGATESTTTLIRMNDSGTNQDACQGDTLTINWSSN